MQLDKYTRSHLEYWVRNVAARDEEEFDTILTTMLAYIAQADDDKLLDRGWPAIRDAAEEWREG